MESLKSILKSETLGKISRLKKDQLVILLLFGVLLIVIALPAEPRKEGVEKDTEKLTGSEAELVQTETGVSYEEQQEVRLKKALEKVAGVGETEVMLTLASSSEKIVEKDQPSESQLVEEADAAGGSRTIRDNSVSETTVYEEGSDGGRTPYVVRELEPKVEGVIVVAQGGGDARVRQDILEAVQALFPVEAHKIKIMKMEGSK